MEIKIYDSYKELSAAAADIIINVVKGKPEAVLCFATGNTPVMTYRLLAEKAKAGKVDFSKCFCIGLDEWLGVPLDNNGSCRFTLQQQVFHPLGITDSQVYLFNGMTTDVEDECRKMNAVIEKKGGIDLMLVGVGVNGHIGFNEPGVDMSLYAHEQVLHETTLTAGQQYFSEPTKIKKGITLGMVQIMKAGTLLLLANGNKKAAIMKQVLEGEITNKVPASYIRQHDHGIVMLDKEAASLLEK
jgi:glucosamine-6-phosphate isomerase